MILTAMTSIENPGICCFEEPVRLVRTLRLGMSQLPRAGVDMINGAMNPEAMFTGASEMGLGAIL